MLRNAQETITAQLERDEAYVKLCGSNSLASLECNLQH